MKILDRDGLERLWLHIIGRLGEKVDRSDAITREEIAEICGEVIYDESEVEL